MDKKKQQQAARRKQEDAALNKLMIWFSVAIGYEAVILLIKRFYLRSADRWAVVFSYGVSYVFRALVFLCPVAVAACIVWLAFRRKKGGSWHAPAIWIAALAVLWVTAFIVSNSGSADLLSAVAPVAAVLAMIYYLYQREFFCNTVLAGAGIFSLWLFRKSFQLHPTMIRVGYVLGWVLLAAAAALAWKLSQTGGKWKNIRLFPDDISYLPTYATCGLTAVCMAAALIGGSAAAFYAIFVLVIWLFCMAVYYTVRLR